MLNPSSIVNTASLRLNEGWRLPFDVVSGVMISRRSTVSGLMKTCRTLYKEGPKHLLRGGVRLSSTDEITKFATFMLVEDTSRFVYLRTLALRVERLAYTDAEADLIRLLSHPSLALEALVLRPAETYLGLLTDPALRVTIGTLMTVKHLAALGVDAYGASLINRLPWDLESISLSTTCAVRDVLPMLGPFSDTLQTVLVDSESEGTRAVDHFFGADPGSCRFPYVRIFGIEYNESTPHLLTHSAFSTTFPALSHLQLIPSEPSTTWRYHSLRTSREIIRPRALGPLEGSQLLEGRRRESPPSLSSLTECSGGLRSVYALRLDCTLSKLRLWQDIQVDELNLLRAVLEDTHPACLCLSTELLHVEALYAILRTIVPPKRIDMNILVPKGTSAQQLRTVLEMLLLRVPMGLDELNVLFDISSYWPAQKSAMNSVLEEYTTTHQASTLAPSLRFICRPSEESDQGDWQWPDLGQRMYSDHDIHWNAEGDRYPFGDGEDIILEERRSEQRLSDLRWSLLGTGVLVVNRRSRGLSARPVVHEYWVKILSH